MDDHLRFGSGLKHLPIVEVSEEEFLAALMAEGRSKDDAVEALAICKQIGGSILVGDKILKLKSKETYSAEG